MDFEKRMKKLEKVIDELHSQQLSLEKSIDKFQEGVSLAGECMKSLEAMRKKIEIVSRSKDGKMQIKPFDQDRRQTPEE